MKRLLLALLALVAFPAFAAAPLVKWSLVTQAAGTGTPTFNQDFTDSTTFGGGTPEFALCWSAGTSTTDTGQANYAFALGAIADAVEGSIALLGEDAETPTAYAYGNKTTFGYHHVNGSGNVDGSANLSLIANGVRFAWTDQSVGETISCLIGDGEIEASLASYTSTNVSTEQTVTHGLSGTPDLIIAWGNGNAVGDNNGALNPGIGFWTSGTEVGFSHQSQNAQATTAVSALASSTTSMNRMGTGTTFAYSGNIANVGATTFGLTYSANHVHTAHFLSIRSTTDTALYVKAGNFTTKTSTGTQADVTGMSGAPQVMLTVGTQLTAMDTGSTADLADAMSFGAAVKNTGTGSTQYGSAAVSDNDNTTASSAHACNQWSNTVGLKILATNCSTDVAATVNSWDSGGVTHNYTANGSGVAAITLYLAFGGTTAVAPTFSVAPTVSAQDTNDYTLSYTPSTSATFYAVACAKDSTAPTVAQVKAGNCTGDVAAIASANEAVTGADTTVLGGSLTRYVHDIYAVLSNGAGDTTLQTLADECLDAASGRTLINCATGYTSIDGDSPIVTFNTSANPDIVAGDIGQCDSTTSPGVCAITWDNTGLYSYPGSCGASRQSFTCNFYDTSVGNLHADTMSVCVNNSSPVSTPILGTIVLIRSEAMSSIDFSAYFSDADDATLTYTSSDSGEGTGTDKRPAGTSITAGVWSGTPTTTDGGTGQFTITGTDSCGDTALLVVDWGVYDTVTVPACVGVNWLTCVSNIEAENLSAIATFACDNSQQAGKVISQSPAASTTVNPFTEVDIIVSTGTCNVTRKIGIKITTGF